MRPDDGRVISNFIRQALADEDMTIHGDGSQTRSFCFVDDLVDGLVRLMASDEARGLPVNLGNPQELTVDAVVEMVRRQVGTRSRVIHLPLPEDDPTRRKPDISRALALLDWRPTTALATGLAKTIGWFRAELAPDAETPALVAAE